MKSWHLISVTVPFIQLLSLTSAFDVTSMSKIEIMILITKLVSFLNGHAAIQTEDLGSVLGMPFSLPSVFSPALSMIGFSFTFTTT